MSIPSTNMTFTVIKIGVSKCHGTW